MRRYRTQKKRTGLKLFKFLLVVTVGVLCFNYLRPLPQANASIVNITTNISSVKLQWPARGVAAVGAQGFGTLETYGSETPRPMASIAKVVTALAILEKHPLKPGQQGPVITMAKQDVDLFNKYFGMGGAYVKVEENEKITLYQTLQAILLPSANNMADGMALWAFGSMESYHAYANAMLKRLGLKNTVVAGDASGFLPASKSNSSDLIRLGEIALNNPIIAEIVAQKSATIPVHGVIYSANSRLGYNNIIGIKTGLTDEAGGCFLFAAKHEVAKGHTVTIIGVIMGADNLRTALEQSEPLLNSSKPYFTIKTPVKAGETFASLSTSWQSGADVVAGKDIKMVAWDGSTLSPRIELSKINRSLPAGSQVGTALISSGANTGATPLVLKEDIEGPTWQWRLKRF